MPLDELGDLVGALEDVAPSIPAPPIADAPLPAGADAVAIDLAYKLAAVRGDHVQERAAFASAIDAFMSMHASGSTATEVSCAEFLWEGDGKNPPMYGRVPDATNDEISRWFKFLVEEKQAYDERIR